jgi:hypothetical protein
MPKEQCSRAICALILLPLLKVTLYFNYNFDINFNITTAPPTHATLEVLYNALTSSVPEAKVTLHLENARIKINNTCFFFFFFFFFFFESPYKFTSRRTTTIPISW